VRVAQASTEDPARYVATEENDKNWPGRLGRARPWQLRFIEAITLRAGLAPAAGSPGGAATATATAATATSATSTATAASTAASTPAAASPRSLHGVACVFLVEEMEGREADIGDFFFTERDRVAWHKVQFLRGVRGRHCGSGCASHEPKSQSGGTQRGRSDLCQTLPLRSLLHPSHRRILHTWERLFQIHPFSILRSAHTRCKTV